jgi:hypothetical protein
VALIVYRQYKLGLKFCAGERQSSCTDRFLHC